MKHLQISPAEKLSSSSIIELINSLSVNDLSVAERTAIYDVAKKVATDDMSKMKSLTSPLKTTNFLRSRYKSYDYEVFGVISLSTQHRVISIDELARGTIDAATVYPREIVKHCLDKSAGACIFYHNHPSGNAVPSEADKRLTKKLIDALTVIDVRVLDHFVLGSDAYYSFAEHGEM